MLKKCPSQKVIKKETNEEEIEFESDHDEVMPTTNYQQEGEGDNDDWASCFSCHHSPIITINPSFYFYHYQFVKLKCHYRVCFCDLWELLVNCDCGVCLGEQLIFVLKWACLITTMNCCLVYSNCFSLFHTISTNKSHLFCRYMVQIMGTQKPSILLQKR